MVQITINEQTFNLKDSWEEITLFDFCEIQEINQKQTSEILKFIEVLGVLSGERQVFVNKILNTQLEEGDLQALEEGFSFLKEDIVEKTMKKEKPEFFLFEGEKYVFKKEYAKFTLGEMSSFEILLKDKKETHPFILSAALLLRKYENQDFNADDMLYYIDNVCPYLLITDVIADLSFFLLTEKNSITKNSKPSLVMKKI
jgi:hypothetical protein